MKRALILALSLLSMQSGLAADRPLFAQAETLHLVLEFPLKSLLNKKETKTSVPGLLRYVDSSGKNVVLDIDVSTRGNSRLTMCRYPPLTINLKKRQVRHTHFAGQNKLKLVTLCRDNRSYRRYMHQEYLIYRVYNLVSDYSFRVRQLAVTYREPDGRQPKAELPAFFIESENELAERSNMVRIETGTIRVSQLDDSELGILTLFQFMIGNTDWSVKKGPGSEDCCHNGKALGPPGSSVSWVVVPYDFDQSGLINARYAMPNESLKLKSVRQRLYRGFCSGNPHLNSAIALFEEKRPAIEELFLAVPAGGRPSENEAALEFLNSFYQIVRDPRKVQKQLEDRCRE